jgi:hypothetical protein
VTTRLLYATDLLLVLFWTQDRSRESRATHDARLLREQAMAARFFQDLISSPPGSGR